MTAAFGFASALLALLAAVVFARGGFAAFERRSTLGLARAWHGIVPSDAWLLLFLSAALVVEAARSALPGASSDVLASASRTAAALAALPLAYVTSRYVSGSRAVALVATAVLGLAAGSGLGIGFSSAQDEGSAALAVATPALALSGLLVFAAHGKPSETARRLRLVSLATALWYVAAAMAATAPDAAFAFVARCGVLVAAALVHVAYFAPRTPGPRPIYWESADANPE